MNTSVTPARQVPGELRLEFPKAALALLSLSQLLIALDATIVFVALDAMGASLGLGAQHLQWIISGYSVAFGGCLLLGGRCADLLGRRRMYVLGMALFGLASLIGGFAHHAWMLIAARAGQGIAAALLFPATLSLINNCYREGAERNRALAIWSMASAGGLAAGALLGGVLTQWLGWNWVLWVMVPIAWPCALLATRFLPKDVRGNSKPRKSFDLAGCITVTLGSSLLVTALVQGPDWGWTSVPSIGTFGASLVLLAVFAWIELSSSAPLVPMAMLRAPSLRTAMALAMVFMSSYGVQYYFLALYFQQIFGWSPLLAGLAFLLPTAMCTIGIRWAERWLRHASVRTVLMMGWALGSAGLAWVAWVLPHGSNYLWLVPGLLVMSVGQGASWTAMWIVAGQGIAADQQGVASGIAATAQQVGAAVGLAVLVMVAAVPVAGLSGMSADAAAVRIATANGLQYAEWGAALFALVGLVIAYRMKEIKTSAPQAHTSQETACSV